MENLGVIFDLDGVLCFTDHLHYKAWKALAERENIEFTEEDNNRLRGVSRQESLEILLEKATRTYTDEEKMQMCQEKNELYRNYLSQLSPSDLSETVNTVLMNLREQNIPMAVGSSSKNTELILTRLGLSSFFNAVVDGTMVSNSKPHPEVFLLAAKKLGLSPEHCIVVEDAIAGIKAAKAAGMISVGIGEVRMSDLVDYGIDSLHQLLTIIKSVKDGIKLGNLA